MEIKLKSKRDHLTWLATKKERTRKIYQQAWNSFEKFLKPYDENWLLEHKTDDIDWAEQLVEFHRMLKKEGLSGNTAKTWIGAIRGYLKYLGIGVNFTNAQRREVHEVGEKPFSDFPFSIRTKKALLMIADEEDEWIISGGISFGLRIGDFLKLRRGDIEKGGLLEQEPPIFVKELQTGKADEKAYLFLDRDAQYAAKRLLAKMDREGRKSPKEKLITLGASAVNKRLEELFKKADIKKGNDRIRFHCLRKWLCDELSRVMSESKWKQIVGKSISEGAYISSSSLKEDYAKVIDLTNINGETIQRGKGVWISQEDAEILRKYKAALQVGSLLAKGAFKGPVKIGDHILSLKEQEVLRALAKAADYRGKEKTFTL